MTRRSASGWPQASESGDSADSIAAVQTLADALRAVLGSHVCERSGLKHRRHTPVRNSVLNDIGALSPRRLRWELIVPKLYLFGQPRSVLLVFESLLSCTGRRPEPMVGGGKATGKATATPPFSRPHPVIRRNAAGQDQVSPKDLPNTYSQSEDGA